MFGICSSRLQTYHQTFFPSCRLPKRMAKHDDAMSLLQTIAKSRNDFKLLSSTASNQWRRYVTSICKLLAVQVCVLTHPVTISASKCQLLYPQLVTSYPRSMSKDEPRCVDSISCRNSHYTICTLELKMTNSSKPLRKLRKSCSLASCSRLPGECMHCACDGRCGLHGPGQCGERREGSGPNCKRSDCAHDETCTHSTRASCCQCRNLVTTQSRLSRSKRAKSESSLDRQASGSRDTLPTTMSASSLPTHVSKRPRLEEETPQWSMQDALSFLLTDVDDLTERALCEYPQWRSRRSTCNLIVTVDGIQFNLHKHPVLFHSALLRTRVNAHVENASTSSVPAILNLDNFPGGADAFDRLCIFMYTGDLPLTPHKVAVVSAGAAYLEMSVHLHTKLRIFVDNLVVRPTDLVTVMHATNDYLSHTEVKVALEAVKVVDYAATALPRTSLISPDVLSAFLQLPLQVFQRAVRKLSNGHEARQKELFHLYLNDSMSMNVKVERMMQIVSYVSNEMESVKYSYQGGHACSEPIFGKMAVDELNVFSTSPHCMDASFALSQPPSVPREVNHSVADTFSF